MKVERFIHFHVFYPTLSSTLFLSQNELCEGVLLNKAKKATGIVFQTAHYPSDYLVPSPQFALSL